MWKRHFILSCGAKKVVDQIESCGVWPKGGKVITQREGAKAHADGAVQGTIEDSSFTGDGKDDVRVDVAQRTLQTPTSGTLGPSMPARRNSRDWKPSSIISRE